MKTGIEIIAEERARQQKPIDQGGEGRSVENDQLQSLGQLAGAAACYALCAAGFLNAQYIMARRCDWTNQPVQLWPWADSWWKPSTDDQIKNLKRAGALIAAEIDRIQLTALDEKS